MFERQSLLAELEVGDIFHATAPNGASLICLVTSVTQTAIFARRVTSQENLEFDRQTGVEKDTDEQALAVMDSVSPLPPEIHNVFLALDGKYGRMEPKDWDEPGLERFKLTAADKKALLFVGPHYAANPLPPL